MANIIPSAEALIGRTPLLALDRLAAGLPARILAKLERLEALRLELKEDLEAVLDEEQEALDNMPESLQDGEKGQQMQEYIDAIENALDDLEEIDVDDIRDQIDDIVG